MSVRRQAKRIAAGAGVALATSGLSNCHDNGVLDPAVPPLQCGTVGSGQTLTAAASRAGADTVNVTIGPGLVEATWQVDSVTDVVGATLVSTRLPAAHSVESLGIVLRLDDDSTTRVLLTVEATFFGMRGEACAAVRTFELTIASGGVQISLADSDPLPLATRQRAAIVLVGRAGRVVELVADTQWRGERDVSWTVSDGTLDAGTGPAVRWTLPAAAGIYQAELVVDFGAAGLAIDTLLLEVV